jgi:hypothetical protein
MCNHRNGNLQKKNPHEREIFPALVQSTGMVKFSYLRCPTNTLGILSEVVNEST